VQATHKGDGDRAKRIQKEIEAATAGYQAACTSQSKAARASKAANPAVPKRMPLRRASASASAQEEANSTMRAHKPFNSTEWILQVMLALRAARRAGADAVPARVGRSDPGCHNTCSDG
jgi:hypothetical protein